MEQTHKKLTILMRGPEEPFLILEDKIKKEAIQ
jgi:hypothetical protein